MFGAEQRAEMRLVKFLDAQTNPEVNRLCCVANVKKMIGDLLIFG